MKKYQNYILIAILLMGLMGCNMSPHQNTRAKTSKVIVVQPFSGFPMQKAREVYLSIKKINGNTLLKQPIPLPTNAYFAPRNRYRADSLIKYLAQFGNADTVFIGLTDKDISTTKGNVQDWGVMGLGYRPGNACVVSTFRLSKTNQQNQLYKVAIHELGHTQGLPHCPNPTCFMRDAEGGNPIDEEKDFCPNCKSFLQKKGWVLK